MPLYDFKCRRCGKKFEELVRLGETPECPKCHAPDPEQLFSMTAGVTTDKTRKRSAKIARQRASAVKREKDAADREYQRNYIKDHSG
jgi:putative FmdB family regulatory protein